MSGVGEYKTRKGNMSGPSLVGFLAPDTHNALRKQPEVTEMPGYFAVPAKDFSCTCTTSHTRSDSEVCHA